MTCLLFGMSNRQWDVLYLMMQSIETWNWIKTTIHFLQCACAHVCVRERERERETTHRKITTRRTTETMRRTAATAAMGPIMRAGLRGESTPVVICNYVWASWHCVNNDENVCELCVCVCVCVTFQYQWLPLLQWLTEYPTELTVTKSWRLQNSKSQKHHQLF